MTRATLLMKNLTRNKLRTTLTICAVALPLFVFTVAQMFVDATDQFLQDMDLRMRVAVHGKLTFTQSLPQRLREDIEAIAPEGYLEAVCRTSWFGGKVKGQQSSFMSFGADRDTFHIVYPEFGMTPEQTEAFQRERRGMLVSQMLAKQQNWELGQAITLEAGIPPFPDVEFVVVGILPDMPGPRLYFGMDYYNEVWEENTATLRGVNNFWVKCKSPQGREWALAAIDDHFSNSEHETQTEMESTFIAAFLKSGGDWVGMMGAVGKLVVLVALAVAFNTMSMAFRERTREIAVLRALGFQPGRIVSTLLSEGILLGAIGGAVAVLITVVLVGGAAEALSSAGMPQIDLQQSTLLFAFGVAVACGLFAALVPAVMAGRLQISAALRKVV